MISQHWTISFSLIFLFACGGSPKESNTPKNTSIEGTVEDGEAFIAKGDYESARSLFLNLSEKSSNDARVYYYLGLTQKHFGESDAAIASYEKALSIDPELADARINLGLALLDKGDLKNAEAQLSICLKANPDASDANFNYGLVQEAVGNFELAKKHYNKAMELDPNDPSPLFGLGDLERKSKKPDAALNYYNKALELAPDMSELLFAKGELLLEMKREKPACETFLSIINDSETALAIAIEAAKLVSQTNDECAMTIYKAILKTDDTFASAHFFLANLSARKQKFAEAVTHFERFLELAPNDPASDEAKKRLSVCKANLK